MKVVVRHVLYTIMKQKKLNIFVVALLTIKYKWVTGDSIVVNGHRMLFCVTGDTKPVSKYNKGSNETPKATPHYREPTTRWD